MANPDSKVRVAEVAGRQSGRVAWWQLRELDVPRSTVSKWCRQGYLHRRLPTVYAVGHTATTIETRLAEALLYAGPGAMLSHQTAAWWLGLIDNEPHTIHVSTPRQPRSLPRIKVHRRRTCEREWHRRGATGLARPTTPQALPTTTLPQTFLDLAATSSLRILRRALAQADYDDNLDIAAIDAELGRGRRGSKHLREALERHRPELAHTKSHLERIFLEICEDEGWPLPKPNQYIAGWQVDALWPDKQVAVELDGHGNHHSPAQLRRDRKKELDLRRAGLTPVRYSEEQLKARDDVIADIRRLRGTR